MLTETLSWTTPKDSDLGLLRIGNGEMEASLLPSGSLFALEHKSQNARIMINQMLGSPIASGIGRVLLRTGGSQPSAVDAIGPGRNVHFGADDDRAVWHGACGGLDYRTTLWFAPDANIWLWRVEAFNRQAHDADCDAVLIQDIGLGERGFLMNNEAYASQYLDHHVESDKRCGPVIMCRQNLAQRNAHPWVIHGCLDGATAFATDALQTFGPQHRSGNAAELRFGENLPGERLQHEAACVAIQSHPAKISPGSSAMWTFFAVYVPDHPDASGHADLVHISAARDAASRFQPREIALSPAAPSIAGEALPLAGEMISGVSLASAYPERLQEETREGRLLSFFTGAGAQNRHVVAAAKEAVVTRRHGAILRSGRAMLPDDALLCATAWMHGVFAAQLTLGNTSLHKLFSVSRDPYNIMRTNGLRILADLGHGWRLLTVPSIFEMGLSGCLWDYRAGDRRITVRAASGDDPAMQWEVKVEGEPCRFLIYGHLVLGEREYDHAGSVTVDAARKRFTFRPDPQSLWSQRYPHASYHLVTGTPAAVEAIGSDELLFDNSATRTGGYAVLRTRPVSAFRFAVTGSLTDQTESDRLAAKLERNIDVGAAISSSTDFWTWVTRGMRIAGRNPDAAAFDAILPWLVQNAMIHLTAPHGLEQYTGAAWGTRDVCQGAVEFLLSFEHDEPVKTILRMLFAEQYESRGDWSQWFMLEPYSSIRDAHAHGDVIVWPLKALCDYVEATGDVAFLDERVAWRRDGDLAVSEHKDTVADHAAKLIATVRERFIPGTALVRYGEGDWNDSLQPADPHMRDWMVSSWTVALLFQQLRRYAQVLAQAGREPQAEELKLLANVMRDDFNKHLIRDETVAGYAIFNPDGGEPEFLLHPRDQRTGLAYSLLPMTRAIIGDLFTPEQARHHMKLISEHLSFPDGVRLMDRPVTYRGGPELVFRRAESSSFFGREIGLMYVHAHLRFAEALAVLNDAGGLWNALLTVNPITAADRLANACLRQRNAYFSSSDARFADRYQASSGWDRVKSGEIAVDGGWRIYSSGPGLFLNMLIRYAFGQRRNFGARINAPMLPNGGDNLELTRGNVVPMLR